MMNEVDIGRYSKRVVQLFWDPVPKNDDTERSPIWCLGHRYDTLPITESSSFDTETEEPSPLTHRPAPSRSASSTHTVSTVGNFEKLQNDSGLLDNPAVPTATNGDDWPDGFLDDFESRYRFTYRSGFPPIPCAQDPRAASAMSLSVRLKSQLTRHIGFTSDTGWGCMIRSGQSMLANALVLANAKRGSSNSNRALSERRIMSWFADDPRAPLSIHKFVEHGAAVCGTFPGQWFGPSATAKCIETLTNTLEEARLKVYVTGDGPDVFEDRLFTIARDGTDIFTPTLLLVGTRLGIDRVTPAYWDALKASLKSPQSVGIAGGRPSSSHYFIGTQGSQLFYLDPHQTTPFLPFYTNPVDYATEHIKSCHTRRLRRMSIEELDPSMLIGFLFCDEAEWTAWRTSVLEAAGMSIFHVTDSKAASTKGMVAEREEALDEIETIDDDFDETHND